MWRTEMRVGRWLHRHRLLGRLATPLWNLSVRLYPPPGHETVAHCQGMILQLPPGLRHARWYQADEYEPELTRLFHNITKPGMVVLDIGANVGYYSILSGRLGATVYAFEPDLRMVSYLRRNIAANGVEVTVIEAAAAEYDGELAWESDPTGIGSRRGGRSTVRAVRVDRIAPERVDLVKIDVEGTEQAVLEGMADTVGRNPQITVVMEYGGGFRRTGDSYNTLMETLNRLGFTHGRLAETGETFSLVRPPQPTGITNLVVTRQ